VLIGLFAWCAPTARDVTARGFNFEYVRARFGQKLTGSGACENGGELNDLKSV
jgi:hypothetical protein